MMRWRLNATGAHRRAQRGPRSLGKLWSPPINVAECRVLLARRNNQKQCLPQSPLHPDCEHWPRGVNDDRNLTPFRPWVRHGVISPTLHGIARRRSFQMNVDGIVPVVCGTTCGRALWNAGTSFRTCRAGSIGCDDEHTAPLIDHHQKGPRDDDDDAEPDDDPNPSSTGGPPAGHTSQTPRTPRW
jgi:hypothetical protein